MKQERLNALLCCYLGRNAGLPVQDSVDEKIWHTKDNQVFLVVSHAEGNQMEYPLNGWFPHYRGCIWQTWQAVGGMNIYRLWRAEDVRAA